jgi:hypothetical protein
MSNQLEANEENIFNILKRMQEKETGNEYKSVQKQLNDISLLLAVGAERNLAAAREFAELKDELLTLKKEVKVIADMAAKWRGAFIMLMGLGGAGGAVLAFWDRFAKWVHP